MERTTEPTKSGMQGWLDTLETKRDELRVKLHLAGMDLEKEWDPIQEKLRNLVELEGARDESRLRLHLAKLEAQEELGEIAEKLEKLATAAERVGQDVSADVKEAVSGMSMRVRQLMKPRGSA